MRNLIINWVGSNYQKGQKWGLKTDNKSATLCIMYYSLLLNRLRVCACLCGLPFLQCRIKHKGVQCFLGSELVVRTMSYKA